jgi:endonuclease/exonuclease/phosphatase family metal-dependent hydrolase
MRRQPWSNARAAMALGLALAVGGCDPLWQSQDEGRVAVPVFRAANFEAAGDAPAPAQLRVVAWNIKYGAARIPFWFDCWGDNVAMDAADVRANLDAIAATIDEMNADIVMLEEIEVNSRRSAYLDMVQYLLDHTRLNEGAYFETWRAAYIPSEGLGRMQLGNAILSRYPITLAESIRQVDRTDQDPLTSALYIHRAVGRVVVRLAPSREVAALVVHTEAYDNDGTKQKQIEQIHELFGAETLPAVLGGDFNELPPNAARLEGFPDERETAVCSADFAQPPYTPEVMQPFYDDFAASIPLARYGSDEAAQARYYTHTVLGPEEVNEHGVPGDWNRTLDYLFANAQASWVAGQTDVLQRKGQKIGEAPATGPDNRPTLASDPLRLSDHAPVFGVLEVQ